MKATRIATTTVAKTNGRNSRIGEKPAAFITMISESVASLFSVCEIAIISAIGEMISTSAGITRLVTPRKVMMVWPWLVIRSTPRNACVIQITPVRLTKTSANDASVVRKIYLSIDPIVYRTIPTLANRSCYLATNPEFGIPFDRAATAPAGSLSHYHPFDPSTKWLSQGAVKIWLIKRVVMLPASHGRRLAAPPLRGHSASDRALDGLNLPTSTFQKPPGGFPTSDSPDFWRIFLCPPRPGSASSLFPPPPGGFSGCSRL